MKLKRLTTRIEDKVYYSKGKYKPTTLIAEMEISEIRECISKLAEYEDIGLTPREIRELFGRLEKYEWKYGSAEAAMDYAEYAGKL